MSNANSLENIPELNILEKIFFQFYTDKIYELPKSKEHIIAQKNETEKLEAFMEAMDSEYKKIYYEYEEARNRVESHLQYQSFLLGIKFSKEMEKIIKR